MNRGTIKVMVNSAGVTRIQEDTGDSVKVYSASEWEAKRQSDMAEVKPEKKGKKEKKEDEDDGLLEDDPGALSDPIETDEAAAPVEDAPVKKVRKSKK
jgi:hypothetical protein